MLIAKLWCVQYSVYFINQNLVLFPQLLDGMGA